METTKGKRRKPSSACSVFVIVLFGPPGSGKGTQAERLEEKYNARHVDTGRLIEKILRNPARRADPVIEREKKLFESGILNTPEWVVQVIGNEAKRLARAKTGIIFSGSPRTLYEAERIVPLLEDLFGIARIIFFRLNVSGETSLFRNSHRKICALCGKPIMFDSARKSADMCAKCGGKLRVRILDKPDIIHVRFAQYEERTRKVFEFLERRGYDIYDIDGESDPETVHESIMDILKNILANRKNK